MLDWQEAAHTRRQEQSQSIPVPWRLNQNYLGDWKDARPIIESCGILRSEELVITNVVDARILANAIRSRKWTSEAVTTAFCKRAAVAQQLTGCCTEMMFEEAIQKARELDEHLSRTGKAVGPLHGVPISLKDSHEVKGYDTTVGWVGLLNQPALADNIAVQHYRSLGAMIYCKTNIPQSLMMSDSYNHVFGQSVNSLNRHLISGGSSGGEGAMVGAKASIIGMGTDIGGSIRIPAALQGLYGLCPSTGRVPNRESSRHQKHLVPPVAGPITTSLSSIEYFMSSYLAPGFSPWDSNPQILPIPWRSELATPPSRPLKIAYVIDDGVVRPHPPIARAMHETMSLLQTAGHELIPWTHASTHASAYHNLWLPSVLSDGGQRCADLCKLVDEPLIEGMLVGKPSDRLDVTQRQELAEKIWEYQAEYVEGWKAANLDALITPVLPWVGMKPRTWVKSRQYCGYTAIWNLLNYTALAIPTTTTVSKELDTPDEEWNSYEAKSFPDQFNHDLYDVEMLEGMPVGLQIVTGRYGEEKAVAVASVVEQLQIKHQQRRGRTDDIDSEDVDGLQDASTLIQNFVDGLVKQLPDGLRGQNTGLR